MLLLLLSLHLIILFAAGSDGNKYEFVATCLCPGYEILIKCTWTGSGTTLWRGTYFDQLCRDGPIVLRRNNNSVMTRICDAERLTVTRINSVMNGTFSSQLMVNMSESMQRKTIECVHNDGTEKHIIGSTQIHLNVYLPPPTNVTLSNISRGELTFSWNPVSHNCTDIQYNIITAHCGDCPETTAFNSVTCINVSANMPSHTIICIFSVQTVVCDSILGRPSEPIAVPLQGPSPPTFIYVRALHTNRSLHVSFNESDSPICYQINHNSTTSYTITYYDPLSGITCGLENVSASSCVNGSCNKIFNITMPCLNLTRVSVTIYGTNVVGDGRESDPVTIVFEDSLEDIENEYNPSTVSITTVLYSVLGGIAMIIVLLILVSSIKCFQKIHSRRTSQNVQSHQQSTTGAVSTVNTDEGNELGIYSTIQYSNCDDDDDEVMNEHSRNRRVEQNETPTPCPDPENTLDAVIYENNFHEIDKCLNLDNLLIQIRPQVTPKWYQFGLAVGISKETLDELSNFRPEECIVEMLDLWLRTSETAITWRDVADALKQTGFHQLAEKILKVYKTGSLPTEVNPCNDTEETASPSLSFNDDSTEICPPLPCKTYQTTNELI